MHCGPLCSRCTVPLAAPQAESPVKDLRKQNSSGQRRVGIGLERFDRRLPLAQLGSASVKEVAATLGVSRSTLHRSLATPDPATLDRGTAELRQVFATRTAAESRPLAI